MIIQAYTVIEAMKLAGVGRTSLYSAIARGQLPARKMGSRTLIMSNDLEAWLNSLPALKPSKAKRG